MPLAVVGAVCVVVVGGLAAHLIEGWPSEGGLLADDHLQTVAPTQAAGNQE